MKKFIWVLSFMIFLVPASSFASDVFGNFQFKLGGYHPEVDEEFGGSATPFADVFDDDLMLMGEIEIDMYFWSGFGKLGLGINAGYTTTSASVLTEDGSEVEDTTSFSVWPLRTAAVYRLDVWANDEGFPLVFVAKLGLDFHHWNTRDTNDNVSSVGGIQGSGWKWGWHASLGIDLLLDFIDTSSAANFDLNWGVNNTYFTVEWVIQNVDDFGGGGIDLSDNFFLFGLNFEY